jgi:ribonuclease E
MTKRMLIDSSHAEETRVVVMDENRLEDFDYENSLKQQLKGNIYLARVTRVEPSLQAAFVEYGGNRHGFLAFNEIHPDYYRIPVEDREALLAEEAAAGDQEDDDGERQNADENDDADGGEQAMTEGAGQPADDVIVDAAPSADDAEPAEPFGEIQMVEGEAPKLDAVGGDSSEELPPRRRNMGRRYKIQEVVTRRQIMLVQVVKEERGNKGAALTTYLSLAGRYCVLMPNTARGGGVSRKITNPADRKRLKAIVSEFAVPAEMAVIVRTAGSERTKAEIKRDYEYLLRLWNQVREDTLVSQAPALVHEEASLIKRSVRDLYSRDIDEVVVEGEGGYKAAKTFMRMLMPSHATKVQPYRDGGVPLFQRHQVESQLDAIHNPIVRLRSGGYLVINQTEALVAIDVNSGRSTRERNIEETALKTNLEAAAEVARQLRLRDLAGLVVIDFIDMEERRNQNAVERRMKDAMRNDRARIQLGRISHFGLMEMSRQRLRPSLFEASTQVCPHCNGSGHVRSTESTALHILRAIEEEGIRRKAAEAAFYMASPVALYILNQKRSALADIEARYQFKVFLESDDSLTPPEFRVERRHPQSDAVRREVAEQLAIDVDFEPAEAPVGDSDEEERRGRRRRRGGRRSDKRREGRGEEAAVEVSEEEVQSAENPAVETEPAAEEEGGNRRRRRRGRRGGRRRGRSEEGAAVATEAAGESAADDAPLTSDAAAADSAENRSEDLPSAAENAAQVPAVTAEASPAEGEGEVTKPKRQRRRRKASPESNADATEQSGTSEAEATAELPPEASPEAAAEDGAEAKPKRPRRSRKKPAAAAEAGAEASDNAAVAAEATSADATSADATSADATSSDASSADVADAAAAPKPKRKAATRTRKKPAKEAAPAADADVAEPATDNAQPEASADAAPVVPVTVVEGRQESAQTKRGWWNRMLS